MKFRVSGKEQGSTLLAILKEHCKELGSVKKIKRAIDAKCCKVNGRVEFISSHRLKEGDVVELVWDLFLSKEQSFSTLAVLYEDAEYAIVNKPPGVICTNEHFRRLLPSNAKNYLLVHRLDKETSGLVLMAKNQKAWDLAKGLFVEKSIHKLYLALVDGKVEGKEGCIDNFLGKKGSYSGQTLYGKVPPSLGMRAITKWKYLGGTKDRSLLLCEPVTGRTHQIRVHCSEMGHPILGDFQYGKRFVSGLHPPRHLLHAWKLSFSHPLLHHMVVVEAPIPEDFQRFLNEIPLDAL